jgi:hypothetical protein
LLGDWFAWLAIATLFFTLIQLRKKPLTGISQPSNI